MVLPKAIGPQDSDRLLGELLCAWKNNEEELAYPSDDWFDELWIYEPARRAKIRGIMSKLMNFVNDYLVEMEVDDYIRMNDYSKISYNKGYICIEK
jgi:hypothetical protein